MLRSKANNVHASDVRRPAWVRQQTDQAHLLCSRSGAACLTGELLARPGTCVGLSVAKPHWMVDSLERVEASDAVLPLPAICLAALRLHHQAQAAVKDAAGPFWIPTGHVFTTPRRSAP
jgi:hypothetical protein